MKLRFALPLSVASAGLAYAVSARADDTSNLTELLSERVITTLVHLGRARIHRARNA